MTDGLHLHEKLPNWVCMCSGLDTVRPDGVASQLPGSLLYFCLVMPKLSGHHFDAVFEASFMSLLQE